MITKREEPFLSKQTNKQKNSRPKQTRSEAFLNTWQTGGGGQCGHVAYGLPCVRELLRFLTALLGAQSGGEAMLAMGLQLLTVGLEAGVDHVAAHPSLLALVQDALCRHLHRRLASERPPLFAAALRASLLLFESLRRHLKLQLEHHLTTLMDLIASDAPRVSQEQKVSLRLFGE